MVQAAILARVTRSAVLEVLREDFVRTARAKGLGRREVLWSHVLRNAMIPVITVMGLQFANLLAGTIVVENVFYLPGLGRLIFQSIANRDLIVVRNCVMLLAAMVVIVNFVVDVLYAVIDPRIKVQRPVSAPLSTSVDAPVATRRACRPGRSGGRALRPSQLRAGRRAQPAGGRLGRCSRWCGRRGRPTRSTWPRSCGRPRPRTGSAPTRFGRDIVSLLLVGARSSILVGVIAVGIGLTFGVCLGLIASAQARLDRRSHHALRRLHLRVSGACCRRSCSPRSRGRAW